MRDWRTTVAGVVALLATALIMTGDDTLEGVGMALYGLGVAFGLVSAADAPRPPKPPKAFMGMLMVAGLGLLLVAPGCVTAPPPYDPVTDANLTFAADRYTEDIVLTAGRSAGDPALVEADFPVGDLTWTDYVDTLAALREFADYEDSKRTPVDTE